MRPMTVLLAALAVTGCGDPPRAVNPEPSGVSIRADLGGDHDVAGTWLDIDRVECTTGELIREVASGPLDPVREEMPDPLTMDGLVALDAPEDHVAVDLYAVLEPGCYALEATPLSKVQDKFATSIDCAPSARQTVLIEPGGMAEVTLPSACVGDGPPR